MPLSPFDIASITEAPAKRERAIRRCYCPSFLIRPSTASLTVPSFST